MFKDRAEAGRRLAAALKRYAGKDTIVLGLPRGGVVTAAEVAKTLQAPLDILVNRKLGYPGNPEFGIGAVGLRTEVIDAAVDPAYLKQELKRLRQAAKERYDKLRGRKPKPDLAGKTVILVDDGMATGVSMEEAVKEVQLEKPATVIVAVPVAPREAVRRLQRVAEVVCLQQPDVFFAVGEFYEDFHEVTEEDVERLLA